MKAFKTSYNILLSGIICKISLNFLWNMVYRNYINNKNRNQNSLLDIKITVCLLREDIPNLKRKVPKNYWQIFLQKFHYKIFDEFALKTDNKLILFLFKSNLDCNEYIID